MHTSTTLALFCKQRKCRVGTRLYTSETNIIGMEHGWDEVGYGGEGVRRYSKVIRNWWVGVAVKNENGWRCDGVMCEII